MSPEKAIVEQAKRPSTTSETSSSFYQKSASRFDERSFSPFGFNSQAPAYQTVDLEGININDGLGYTVTITAGQGQPKRRRRLTRLSFQTDPEGLAGLTGSEGKPEWEMETVKHPMRALSRLNRRHALDPVDETKGPIEIHTRRSLEVRESFHTGPAESSVSSGPASTTLSQVERRYTNWALRTSATLSSFGSFLLDADEDE